MEVSLLARSAHKEYALDHQNHHKLLEVKDLRKHFGGVQALKGVSLVVYPGEVHGLVGANGAGKSTLIRILAGVTQRDSGEIYLNGEPVEITNPQQATQLGLSFIHQELNLVPKFNVVQNMTLGLPKAAHLGLINWQSVRKEVEKVAERVGIDFPLETPVQELSVAEKWLVSIGRSLVHRARLIAMDEPTASLSEEESYRLFQIIRELSGEGIGILYVSHRLDEILDLCQVITVFKDGQNILSTSREKIDKNNLVRAIVGGELAQIESVDFKPPNSTVVLQTSHLSQGRHVKDVSFALHRGEVLGLGGLVGSGRTELAYLLFGVLKPDGGEMVYIDRPWLPRDPADAVKQGIGLVPEERRSQGLIVDKSVNFNINLTNLTSLRINRFLPILNLQKASRIARNISEQMRIKTPTVEARVGELSGGNQQKVVIGKWLTRNMNVLILDEPTRGVDVGSRAEIHRIIRELAKKGVSVIVISSDVEELPGLCDRVLVMAEGRIVGSLVGEEISKEAIIHLSYINSVNESESST